jgi:hypothetical protein
MVFFVEQILLGRENVPENATNPGETTVAEVKCPGKRH